MITTSTPQRIDGKDHTGDRWAAHLVPAAPPLGMPPLIAIRHLEGVIHLAPTDAKQLAAWLHKATQETP